MTAELAHVQIWPHGTTTVVRTLSIAAIAIAATVIVGWTVGIDAFAAFAPCFPYTMPLPALVLAGMALERSAVNPRSGLARVAAVLVALEGARALLAYVAGVPTPLLQMVAPATAAAMAANLPPLPAPNAALAILSIGVAILVLDDPPWRGIYPAEVAAGISGLIALVALVAHADGAAYLGTLSASPAMALPTIVCLLLLSVGVFAARSGRGVASIFTSDRLGSTAAVRLIVLVCLAPIIFGWLALMAQRAAFVDLSVAAALNTIATVLVSAGAIAWTAHVIDRVDGVRRELHAERQSAIAQAASVARFRTIFESASVALVEQDSRPLLERAATLLAIDPDDSAALAAHHGLLESMLRATPVVDANPAALRLFEAPSTVALREAWSQTVLPEGIAAFVRGAHAIAAGHKTFETEIPIRTLRGNRREVLVSVAAAEPPTFRTVLTGFVDVTERRRAQDLLLEARRAREAAARSAVEADRRRIARDLHDGVLQELAALKLLLESEAVQKQSDAAALAVRRTSAMLQELRAVVDDLRPHDLIHESLQGAIAAQARVLTAWRPIGVSCDLQPNLRLPDWVVRELYRIAQEAMANAVRHGSPQRISVRLWQRDGEIGLEVEDDGVGFDTGAPARGNGLQSMRERASTLAADLDIESHPGAGTRVRVVLGRDEPLTAPRV